MFYRISVSMLGFLTLGLLTVSQASAQSIPGSVDPGAMQRGMMSPYSGGQTPGWVYGPMTPQDLGKPPEGYENPVQVDQSILQGEIVAPKPNSEKESNPKN